MMKKTWSWLILLCMMIATACTQKDDGQLQVSGTVEHIDQLVKQYPQAVKNGSITLLLYEVPFGGDLPPVQLDSVTIPAGKKSFTLKGQTASTGMYDIVVDNGPMVPLVNDTRNISVKMDFSKMEKFYSVKGSDASQQLMEFIYTYGDKSESVEYAMHRLDSLKQFGADENALIGATNAKNNAMNALNQYVKAFLQGVKQPVVASFALGRSARTLPQGEFEAEMGKLVARFPEDANLGDLKKKYDTYKSQAAELERQRNKNSWVGKPAPELTMPDVNGNKVSLSSFRGKYVLVDFWASWCGPCRDENPNVVAAYHKFKDKNFTVLGVSLDKSKDNWLQAIRQDNLTWTHISDLAFWNSEAVNTFNFNGIPYNVLVAPDGTIIGEGLRGEGLEAKLEEVLN